jgi:hypothetical protein
MNSPFDIFFTDGQGPLWVESAATLDEAKAGVAKAGNTRPGEYLILCQTTGNRLSITVGKAKVGRPYMTSGE